MAGSATRIAGQILEYEFLLECLRRGGVVSQPLGDNVHYDFLVDAGSRIFRVNVKKASPHERGRYSINITRKLRKTSQSDPGGSTRAVSYQNLDYIIANAGGAWFFFGPEYMHREASVYPHLGREEYAGNHGKERWDLIGLRSDDAVTALSPQSPGRVSPGSL